jgi:hypothetical protein
MYVPKPTLVSLIEAFDFLLRHLARLHRDLGLE